MLDVKAMRITSSTTCVTDFMWLVEGFGYAFNIKVNELPDYSENWEMLSIVNECEQGCALRLSIDKTLDIYIDGGDRRLLQLSQLKG